MTDDDDSAQCRQENEFSALTAIYNDAVEDLRHKAAWNAWVPLDFRILVLPQRGESGIIDNETHVYFHVICSERYPYEVPKFQLENSKGMSHFHLNQLEKELKEMAERKKGTEMIYELVQFIQEFLYDNRKPATKSFYEEMMIRQKQQEQFEKEVKKKQFEKERQWLMSEIERRREFAKESNNSDNSDDTKKSNSLSNRRNTSVEVDKERLCEHNYVKAMTFMFRGGEERLINRGKCINHSHRNCVVYNGMDMATGHMSIISEWELPESQNTQKLLTSLEQEFNYLLKIKHQNLAHYQSLKHELVSTKEGSIYLVYLMREFVYGSNCNSLYINEGVTPELDRLKHIANGVLSALDYLHRNNVVHKNLDESCVYLNRHGIIKVANYSLDRRLTDFSKQTSSSSNYNKKNDIYKFGVFLLSIISGNCVSLDSELVIPHTIPPDLYDFISKCVTKTDKDRLSAAELLCHSFLRQSPERISPKRSSEEYELQRNVSPETPPEDLVNNTSFGQSRVNNEFQVLASVGKGAFGEVFKVRNKIDQRLYAIKKILLNPKEVSNYRRLFREVKYLSRLNHENVVRYYNSWIERCPNDELISSRSSSPSVPDVIQQKSQELSCYADVELYAPPPLSINGSSQNQMALMEFDGYDSSDSEDNDIHYMPKDDSFIVFQDEDEDEDEEEKSSKSYSSETETETNKNSSFEDSKNVKKKTSSNYQWMYIQMEFCEKSTLRTAIDEGLYAKPERMWRLFREIVEGLAHIHQQTLIHRDLKPVNIFLDSNDHVKIGDFGLATTCFLSKQNDQINTAKSLMENIEISQNTENESCLTGQIGTALYVAPEIASVKKVSYSAKVDVYSLGVIFFEMCYKPLTTGMERIMILTKLRNKEIELPEDFITPENEKKINLIRWLLNHDVEKRPSSMELLQSNYIPPPVVEERELQEMIRTTLNNPHLKGYKYLIEACFKQTPSPAQDIMYNNSTVLSPLARSIHNYARKQIAKVFSLHGAQHHETPLLMPKSNCYGDVESVVHLMTHSGSIVSLPHDLRAPFARFVAWNSITLMRRYSISRVYREKKVFDSQPRELIECAFDIVSPTPGNFLNDAEVLYILNEIMSKFSSLNNKDFHIYLNHTLLLKAVLLHCGVKENHNKVLSILAETRSGKVSSQQLKSKLSTAGLSEKNIELLDTILSDEGPAKDVINNLQFITKKKNSEAAKMAKDALQEIKTIVQNAECLGVKIPMVLSLRLVHNSILQYSGMTCHLVMQQNNKKNRRGLEVLAAGGRYDTLIHSYRSLLEKGLPLKKGIRQSAVGISISLDKLVQTLQKEPCLVIESLSSIDVGLCSLGSNTLLKEKAKILKGLWAHDIRCCVLDITNIEDVDEICLELNCPHIILMKDHEERNVIVRSKDKERFHDKKVNVMEVVDYLFKMSKDNRELPNTENNYSFTSLTRSESKISNTEKENEVNTTLHIVFETSEKYSSNLKRRYENQIRVQLDGTLKRLQGEVIAIVVNLEAAVIRSISAYLEVDSMEHFEKSLECIIERHGRHKRYLRGICELIYDHKSKSNPPIVALYSPADSFHKFLL